MHSPISSRLCLTSWFKLISDPPTDMSSSAEAQLMDYEAGFRLLSVLIWGKFPPGFFFHWQLLSRFLSFCDVRASICRLALEAEKKLQCQSRSTFRPLRFLFVSEEPNKNHCFYFSKSFRKENLCKFATLGRTESFFLVFFNALLNATLQWTPGFDTMERRFLMDPTLARPLGHMRPQSEFQNSTFNVITRRL